jgi:hypothetical protein
MPVFASEISIKVFFQAIRQGFPANLQVLVRLQGIFCDTPQPGQGRSQFMGDIVQGVLHPPDEAFDSFQHTIDKEDQLV